MLIDSSLFVSAKSIYIPAPFDCIERGTLGVQESLNQQKLPPVTGRPSGHCPCVLCMGGRASSSRHLCHSGRLRRPEGFLKLPVLGSHPQGFWGNWPAVGLSCSTPHLKLLPLQQPPDPVTDSPQLLSICGCFPSWSFYHLLASCSHHHLYSNVLPHLNCFTSDIFLS